MESIAMVCAGETKLWKDIERVYSIISALEDGCSVKDIELVVPEPKISSYARISSAVSKLVLAKNAPVSSEHAPLAIAGAHTGLRVIALLPRTLEFDPMRPRRKRKAIAGAMGKDINLDSLNRQDLLMLKIKINQRLSEMKP